MGEMFSRARARRAQRSLSGVETSLSRLVEGWGARLSLMIPSAFAQRGRAFVLAGGVDGPRLLWPKLPDL